MTDDTEDVDEPESDVEQEEEMEDAGEVEEEETAQEESESDTEDDSPVCAHNECTRGLSSDPARGAQHRLCDECFMPPRRVRCDYCLDDE